MDNLSVFKKNDLFEIEWLKEICFFSGKLDCFQRNWITQQVFCWANTILSCIDWPYILRNRSKANIWSKFYFKKIKWTCQLVYNWLIDVKYLMILFLLTVDHKSKNQNEINQKVCLSSFMYWIIFLPPTFAKEKLYELMVNHILDHLCTTIIRCLK